MLRSPKNEALLEECRAGLEAYLRAIISATGSTRLPSATFSVCPQFMSSTWLEHMDLQARVRDVQADVIVTSTGAMHSQTGGHGHRAWDERAGEEARGRALAEGLDVLTLGRMSEGELQVPPWGGFQRQRGRQWWVLTVGAYT
ncbi:hypothetical protein EDB89DRAFT_2130668 [Lactarius sanguifluus]|nr:hypothetical protein EDB89DRAFT_2130668 [Lactarius sanguifluus]